MGLTAEHLREVLRYSPSTGRFVWRVKPGKNMTAGTTAGCLSKESGYVLIGVGGRLYRAHRLAWLYMTGTWPEALVDHRNRVRSDNRWANLRLATPKQSSENITLRSDNTSGVRGVRRPSRASGSKGWHARIYHHGKEIHLGIFKRKADAVLARRAAEQTLFTHSEHAC